MTFRLRLETVPGTPITDAAFDMVRVSNALGILIEAEFDGVELAATPFMSPMDIIQAHADAKAQEPPHVE